tara:strand:+ start:3713 stop:3880 length:168 start_codon:yes stop_codon:yes gene_type:complete
MILKTSLYPNQNNDIKDLDNPSRKNPTLDNLMTDQNLLNKQTKTVHRRRDLDSLG